jgi:hypothetical protein
MFILQQASDLATKESRWVWNNRDGNEIVILELSQVQSFVDTLFNVNHEIENYRIRLPIESFGDNK